MARKKQKRTEVSKAAKKDSKKLITLMSERRKNSTENKKKPEDVNIHRCIGQRKRLYWLAGGKLTGGTTSYLDNKYRATSAGVHTPHLIQFQNSSCGKNCSSL